MLAASDLAVAEHQLGRVPRVLVDVAARCPRGYPSVLVQAPYDADGTPFPTLYWLSCPALVAAIGGLEAVGGVAILTDELAADPGLQQDMATAAQRVIATRQSLAGAGPRLDGGAALAAGIAGEAAGGGLKCLHAHAALALADPPYRLGALALERAGASYPDPCCLE